MVLDLALRSGAPWPLLGLGTYRLTPAEIPAVVEASLSAGYGLVDTAVSYKHSHHALALALRDRPRACGGLAWVQTKIPPAEQGYEKARVCALRCVEELRGCAEGISVLLHWPGGSRLPPDSPEHARLRLGSWLALQELYAAGTLQCIGVSNFEVRHLRELEAAVGVHTLPLVNQVELHPLLPQTELRAFCAERRIHVQAYSSLGQGSAALWGHPALRGAARALALDEAQVLLLWAMRQGVSVIPRSRSARRVADNAAGLADALGRADVWRELARLDAIGDGTHFCWNPEDIR
ncbi:hypothetical protein KFE25_003998 [Diacronema lutheri]|uniref:NADP-dependent oxidoreductase domain-containing protein n=1 Tax=Diacronema lutheri TaxID=2081491 RepID=A0A8J5XI99_DIALT|nr:hypothetical protein KFE25_003998 [Diacronema lutheri]